MSGISHIPRPDSPDIFKENISFRTGKRRDARWNGVNERGGSNHHFPSIDEKMMRALVSDYMYQHKMREGTSFDPTTRVMVWKGIHRGGAGEGHHFTLRVFKKEGGFETVHCMVTVTQTQKRLNITFGPLSHRAAAPTRILLPKEKAPPVLFSPAFPPLRPREPKPFIVLVHA